MKYLKYTLFIMIIFLDFNVFAQDFNVTSIIKAPTTNASNGTYRGTEIYNTGSEINYNVNTRYDGRLSRIRFWVNLPSNWPDGDCFSTGDLQYRLTVNMATDDFRNNFTTPFISNNANTTNWVTSWSYVSMKKIYINFKIPSTSTCYDKIFVDLKSSNVSSVAITGVSNWNLSNVTLTANFPNLVTPTPTPVTTSTPTPRPDSTNQDIINNQNSNTNSIINNQNSNTNSIINNQNSNTTDIINNQNQNTTDIIDNNNTNTQDIIDNTNENTTCPVGPLYLEYDIFKDSSFDGKFLASDGSLGANGSYSVSVYLKVKPNQEYTVDTFINLSDRYLCFYNQQKTVISCSPVVNGTIISPSTAAYMRISLRKERVFYIKGPICNDWKKEGLDKIADVMSDSSIDDKTGFFTNFNNNTHGLTGIITLPLSTIQNLANTSCVTLSIPVPFTNDNFILPCMTQVYESTVPDIYSMWQVVSFGIISYYICLDIFKMVKGFKDPNEDKVEVLDL